MEGVKGVRGGSGGSEGRGWRVRVEERGGKGGMIEAINAPSIEHLSQLHRR